MTDYFSKWIEAGAFRQIREREVIDYIWDNIICHFDTKEITCDNKSLFIRAKVTNILDKLQVKRIMSSPYHPNANGQAKSTNKIVMASLKTRLKDAKGNWTEELSGVLWAYRTTVKTSTSETPFSLVYGAKALILVEVSEPSL